MVERIQIEEATAEQLRQFGVQVLGLEVTGRENKQMMMGKFTEVGFNMAFITLTSAAPTPTGGPTDERGAFNRRENEAGRKEVRIMIHTVDQPGGDRDVVVAVNGKFMTIPRGKPQWVPESYVEALDHAEEQTYDQYDQSVNDGMGGLNRPRLVKSYPFSFA